MTVSGLTPAQPPRAVLPQVAFTQFRGNFEEPELSEGLSQIKKVNWVFSGTAEERKAWSRWTLQMDKD